MKYLISGIAFALVGLLVGCKRDIVKHVDKVQLWEGGPYWATTNIGAKNPEDYGLYFWWGDTVGYRRVGDAWVASDGSTRNYLFSEWNTPTYSIDLDTLQHDGWLAREERVVACAPLAPEHDAARVHRGEGWRMPTKWEFKDLVNNCDWTWTRRHGVRGYIVRGRGAYSKASIFLPAAGFGDYDVVQDIEPRGYYWSSTPEEGFFPSNLTSWDLEFSSRTHVIDETSRFHGLTVRPVQGKIKW